MSDIYLTCAESDNAVAAKVVAALRSHGLSAVHAGESMPVDAEPAYESSCVVALWSAEAINDPVVMNEAIAGNGRKKYAQALVEDIRPPRRFKRVAIADIIDWDGRSPDDPGLMDLVRAIRSIVEKEEDDVGLPLGYEQEMEDPEPAPIPEGNLFGGHVTDFEGHQSEVYDLAVSADGTQVASACADGAALLWSPDTLEIRARLDCGSEVNDVAFSPDSKLVITASDDGAVRMWRVEDGRMRHRLDHHDGSVYWAAFSPAGTLAASAGKDGRVVVWRVESLEVIWEFDHHQEVATARFLPDGTVLAAADDDGEITLWDLETGDALRVLDAHDEAITDIAVSPDGTLLATASSEGNLSVWNLGDASLQWWSGEIAGAVYGMCFSPDGKLLAESDDEGISLWTAHDGDLADFLTDPNATRLEFSPIGNRLVWASDETVHVITAKQ